MSIRDHYGNDLSTATGLARDHYDIAVRAFLSANHGAVEVFGNAVEADPEFALAFAGLARARMMAGDMAGAKAAIATAQSLAATATERERSHIAAFALLLSGKPMETRRAVMEHVRTWPRDAMVAQMCTNVFGLIGFSGEVGREAELLAFTSALLPHYGEDWWMMSMHALSLCETGQVSASQDLMERALGLNPRNANGAHFKAHAHYEAGETAQGRAYLADWMQTYDARAVLHGHMRWHEALWALQDGDETAMWQAYETGIAPGATHSLPINVLTDSAALLYRAELAGLEVAPDRWARLSGYAAQYFPTTGQSFADLHVALSHAMAGQGDHLAQMAEAPNGFAGDMLPSLVSAWQAIAREQWAQALVQLTPVMATTERLGGSRAQRDLLELAYVNVLLKLGKTDEAQRQLSMRRPGLATPVPILGMPEAA